MIQRFDKIDKEQITPIDENLLEIEKQSIKALRFTKCKINNVVGWSVSAKGKAKKMKDIIVPTQYKDKPVLEITYGTFNGCKLLEKISIPFVGASINDTSNTHFGYIFGAGSVKENYNYIPLSLKTVVITGGDIGSHAFYNCSSLTSVTIGNSVTSIGYEAFYNCSSLTSITIPNSVTRIGKYAFDDCSSLTKVNYTGTIDEWVQINFAYDSYYGGYTANPLNYAKNLYINNELVTNAVITTATKISSYAFYNYTGLTSITIPNSVTSIGDGAFSLCRRLTEVAIPNSVKWIDTQAFFGTKLKSAVFEDTTGWTNNGEPISPTRLKDPVVAAQYLKDGTAITKE